MSNIKQSNGPKRYVMLMIWDHTPLDRNGIAEKFEYEPQFFGDDDTYVIDDWSMQRVSNVVNDIINNSEFRLISVSEDQTSMKYHFLKD